MTTYTTTFQVKRRCAKCKTSKPTAGGRTYPGGRVWVCKDCRARTAPGTSRSSQEGAA